MLWLVRARSCLGDYMKLAKNFSYIVTVIALLTLAGLNFAYACSTPAGFEPSCPSGQHFDGADRCECVNDTPTPAIQKSTEWPGVALAQHCSTSEDCITVTIDAPCVSPFAVNKIYRAEGANYLRDQSNRSFCGDATFTPCHDSPDTARTDAASENRSYCISEAICEASTCKVK